MASIEELKGKLAESRAISKRLAAKTANLERRVEASSRPPAATSRMKSVALRVYALAGLNIEAALAYLACKSREAEGAKVFAWYSALSADEQAGLAVQPNAPGAQLRQWAEAQRFVKELEVVSWVRSQNKKSLAPSPGAALRYASAVMRLSGKQNSQHRWLQRLFSRFGFRKGVFAAGDQLSRETFESKVFLPCVSGS